MDNGSILIVMIIAALIGRRSVTLGVCAGGIATILFYFTFQEFGLKSLLVEIIFGIGASAIASFLTSIIFPGLKGGGHNCGPSYIGGGSRSSGRNSGIVHTDEEIKNLKDNERKTP